MRVLFDASVFGAAAHSPRARTGIFRATEQLVRALVQAEDCELRLCASEHARESAAYWQQHPRLTSRLAQPAPLPHSPLGTSVRRIKGALGKFYYAHQDNPLVRYPFKYGARLPLGLERLSHQWADRRIWRENLAFAEIYHAPHYEWPRPLARKPRIRRFVNVYDLIPIRFPQFFSGNETAKMERFLDKLSPGHWVICPSQSTLDDLRAHLGDRTPHCRVVPLAADPVLFQPVQDLQLLAQVRREYQLDDRPYILSLCTLEPRKNLRTLLKAFMALCAEKALDVQLVMVGPKGWHLGPLMDELSHAGACRDRIVLTGYVPDEDLAALYSGAAAFAYPSLYEGFGLPVLEAMQCGTPVITSKVASLPEVAGDAGLLIDPTDADALAQAMLDLLSQSGLRADQRQRSLCRAAQFSWQRTAAQTIDAYREALA